MSKHLCLSCRYAEWRRHESGRLTGVGFCKAPAPKLPALPATKWWASATLIGEIRGGDIYRKSNFPIANCHFHEKAKP